MILNLIECKPEDCVNNLTNNCLLELILFDRDSFLEKSKSIQTLNMWK